MADYHRKRPTKAEHEQRVHEVGELLLSRVSKRTIVRFAAERWNVKERAVEYYMAAAHKRIRALADYDLNAELGKASGGYEMLFAKQLAKGDLRGARATLDRLVELLGLSAADRARLGEQDADLDAWLASLIEGRR